MSGEVGRMRTLILGIWIIGIYVVASRNIHHVLEAIAITKDPGDKGFIEGGLEWVMALYFLAAFLLLKPLYYYLVTLSKWKLVTGLICAVIAPTYLFISTLAVVPIGIQWRNLLHLDSYASLVLLLLVVSDPVNLLGKWICETEYFQRRIDTWRGYQSLKYYVTEYPPRSTSDVTVGIVWINVIAGLAFLLRIL